MTNQTPESVIAEALRGAGLSDRPNEFASSIHSWRCEHPDVYGRCDFFEITVADIAAALRAANMLREPGAHQNSERWPRRNDYFDPPLTNRQMEQVQECINDALRANEAPEPEVKP